MKIEDLPIELQLEFRQRFGHIISCGRKHVHVVSQKRVKQFLKEKGYED